MPSRYTSNNVIAGGTRRQLMGEIMLKGRHVEVLAKTKASVASQQALRGRIAVVGAEAGQPLGVLTRKTSLRMLHVKEPVGQFRRELAVAGITTPDTPVIDVLRAMRWDRSVNWFLVRDKDKTVGVVTPRALFKALESYPNYRVILGVPPTKLKGCYCCAAVKPPHEVGRNDVNAFDPDTWQPLCPEHRVVMILRVRCACQGG
jgi:CBS domain-containing protein